MLDLLLASTLESCTKQEMNRVAICKASVHSEHLSLCHVTCPLHVSL